MNRSRTSGLVVVGGLAVASLLVPASNAQAPPDQTVPAWTGWQAPITWDPFIASPWNSPTVRPLDQGQEDLGPLGGSLRQVPFDARVPAGFEQVYRGPNGTLIRQDGGIRAVFPRSQYVAGGDGLQPEIPAGTVFQIGRTYPTMQAPTSHSGIDLRVDRRVGVVPMGSHSVGVPESGDPHAHRDSIWSSESYRRSRVAALLLRARSRHR